MIIDKISIVLLKLLATIDTQLSQAKEKPDNNTSILGGLAIAILMGDFHQFFLVLERPLWEEVITTDEFHSKAI